MPPRSSAGLPAPPPHPISPPIRSDPTLSRPLPVSWAPPHPGPPGPAVLAPPAGQEAAEQSWPAGYRGSGHAYPAQHAPAPPSLFRGACRAARPRVVRTAPSGVRGCAGKERERDADSTTRRRDPDSDLPGCEHAKGGASARKGVGPEASGSEAAAGPGKEAGPGAELSEGGGASAPGSFGQNPGVVWRRGHRLRIFSEVVE